MMKLINCFTVLKLKLNITNSLFIFNITSQKADLRTLQHAAL